MLRGERDGGVFADDETKRWRRSNGVCWREETRLGKSSGFVLMRFDEVEPVILNLTDDEIEKDILKSFMSI